MMGGKSNASSGELIQALKCLQKRQTYFTSYNNAEPCHLGMILGMIAILGCVCSTEHSTCEKLLSVVKERNQVWYKMQF